MQFTGDGAPGRWHGQRSAQPWCTERSSGGLPGGVLQRVGGLCDSGEEPHHDRRGAGDGPVGPLTLGFHSQTHPPDGRSLPVASDAADKLLHLDREKLDQLGVPFTEHDKLPDVVLYDEERNWLFLVEAVTSHGPVSPKRVEELEDSLKDCTATRIYVSAFPDFRQFRRHLGNIALSGRPDGVLPGFGPGQPAFQ